MRELVRSSDPVLMSFLRALLADAAIEPLVLDSHASGLYGSTTLIEQRLMVLAEDYSRARRLLQDSGYGGYVR